MIETILGRATAAGTSVKVLARAGIIRPYSPLTLARIAKSLSAWGTGPAGGFISLAARAPDQVGLIDEIGSLTFGEMHQRSNALAHAL
ncbi:MAG: acyl-CoA synthetase, partial [Nocardioides sp.]